MFLDAIRDLNVGMEGHGVWRVGQQACEPGMHYQRKGLLCVCSEDGSWPSPICRDTFRILHPVEVVTDVKNFKKNECEPAKLYLIGCNVCFCPADGVPNPKFCTRNTCAKDENENICGRRKPGDVFNVNCNICQCDEEGLVYCSVKKCLKNYVRSKDDIDEAEFRAVEAPISDIACEQGTKYKKDCNTCYCFKRFGVKKFACTVEKCSSTNIIHGSGCVEDSGYEMNCLLCQCGIYNGKKMEICHKNPKCQIDSEDFSAVEDWVGYCEPMHRFMKDCNPCECLADGRTARCLANSCTKKPEIGGEYTPKSIAVEIVPIVRDIGLCERGGTFTIDCNVCYCLMNGDVICTTEDCKKGN